MAVSARSRYAVIAIVAVPVLTAAMTACSPLSDSDSGASHEGDIRETIERAFVEANAANCAELFTERALEQMNFEDNPDPLANCEEDAREDPDDFSESVTISNLQVTDGEATATAIPEGGNVDGAEFELELVDSDGWRIDHIAGVDILDRGRFLDATLADVTAGENELTATHGRCIARHIRDHATDRTIERAFVETDPTFILDAYRECLGNGSDYRAIAVVLKQTLVNQQGLSESEAACVVGELRKTLRTVTLEEFPQFVRDPVFQQRAQAAGVACVRGSPGEPGSPDQEA
jgi:hypothetical protein